MRKINKVSGTIFRKDRSLLNNIRRFINVIVIDNTLRYMAHPEDSHMILVKDRLECNGFYCE